MSMPHRCTCGTCGFEFPEVCLTRELQVLVADQLSEKMAQLKAENQQLQYDLEMAHGPSGPSRFKEVRTLLEEWMLASDNFDIESWAIRVRDTLEATNTFNRKEAS